MAPTSHVTVIARQTGSMLKKFPVRLSRGPDELLCGMKSRFEYAGLRLKSCLCISCEAVSERQKNGGSSRLIVRFGICCMDFGGVQMVLDGIKRFSGYTHVRLHKAYNSFWDCP